MEAQQSSGRFCRWLISEGVDVTLTKVLLRRPKPNPDLKHVHRVPQNESDKQRYPIFKTTSFYGLLPENMFAMHPRQVVTEYGDDELDAVLEACERMNNHLTAAVVSNNVSFQRRVLEATVNGTTYCGIRAR